MPRLGSYATQGQHIDDDRADAEAAARPATAASPASPDVDPYIGTGSIYDAVQTILAENEEDHITTLMRATLLTWSLRSDGRGYEIKLLVPLDEKQAVVDLSDGLQRLLRIDVNYYRYDRDQPELADDAPLAYRRD